MTRHIGMISPKPGSMLIKGIVVILLMPSTVLWARTHSSNKTVPFTLGHHKLGEPLSYFKARFPGAACGTATSITINRHTLDDPNDSGDLTCCVDDSESLAKFSKFKIITAFDQCPVLAHFWKERLVSLHYVLDISSIEQLLPGFEKLYGPAHRKLKNPDQNDKLDLVSWWYNDAQLELSMANVKGETRLDDSSPNNGMREIRFVQVSLWLAFE
jgi:hypothetical protein